MDDGQLEYGYAYCVLLLEAATSERREARGAVCEIVSFGVIAHNNSQSVVAVPDR
jgi:hypothetical protein